MIWLGSSGLTAGEVISVARRGERVELTDGAVAAITGSRAIVDAIIDREEPLYGVTTGFGSLARTAIPSEQRSALQQSLIRSHAAGMGDPVETEVVRAMMVLRARTLAMGFSGIRLEVVRTLLDVLNGGIVPVVPEHGSLGASGDLAPLAHVALTLTGEGFVIGPAGPEPSGAALTRHDIAPAALDAKDGIALINGTDGILGMLLLACEDARVLFGTAEAAAAMAVEALLGTDRPFAPDLNALRPHSGQAASAANLMRLLAGSPIVASHRYDDPRVQDAYSLRCAPQVIGAGRDTLAHARAVANIELGSAIDNPMVLPDGRIESCGNFHGAPLGYACDFLAIALADMCSMSERRIDRMLDVARSEGLPAFLSPEPGVNSGLMIGQYTVAAICAENRRLAAPASVDSMPTSASQEDHVSMGWGAARKLRRVIANATRVLAIELVAAAHAVDFRRPLEPAPGTGAVQRLIRDHVAGPGPDRFLAPDFAAARDLIASGAVLAAAEAATASTT
ncbi:MAG: histidine ammonia-lyase [Acidimicrobiia bacterium]